MASPFTIRHFEPSDLGAARRLDQGRFEPGISYSRGQIRDFIRRPGAVALVVGGKGEDSPLDAFAVGQVSGSRAHVITIDVAASARRAGVGKRLLEELLARFAAAGA